jgi:hypothetical protein
MRRKEGRRSGNKGEFPNRGEERWDIALRKEGKTRIFDV